MERTSRTILVLLIIGIAAGAIFAMRGAFIEYWDEEMFLSQKVLEIVKWGWVLAICIPLIIFDKTRRRIPNSIIYTGILIAIGITLTQILNVPEDIMNVLTPILTALLVVGVPLFIIWKISKGKRISAGDVKFVLFFCIGLGIQKILIILIITVLITLFSEFFLRIIKKRRRSAIPLGTYLGSSAIITLILYPTIEPYINTFWP